MVLTSLNRLMETIYAHALWKMDGIRGCQKIAFFVGEEKGKRYKILLKEKTIELFVPTECRPTQSNAHNALKVLKKEEAMSDLISRKAVIKAIEELPNCYNGWSDAYDKAYIITTIEEVPTIIDLVRCGECEHKIQALSTEKGATGCELISGTFYEDFFCKVGERRTDE